MHSRSWWIPSDVYSRHHQQHHQHPYPLSHLSLFLHHPSTPPVPRSTRYPTMVEGLQWISFTVFARRCNCTDRSKILFVFTLSASSSWNECYLLTTYQLGLKSLHLSAYDDTIGLEKFIQLSIWVAEFTIVWNPLSFILCVSLTANQSVPALQNPNMSLCRWIPPDCPCQTSPSADPEIMYQLWKEYT